MWGQRRDDASTYLPTYSPPPTQPPPPRVFYSRSSSPRFLYVRILPSLVFFPSSLDFPSNSFVSPPPSLPPPLPLSYFFLTSTVFFFFPPSLPLLSSYVFMGVASSFLRVDDSWWRFRANVLLFCRCKICKGIDDEWVVANALLHYR